MLLDVTRYSNEEVLARDVVKEELYAIVCVWVSSACYSRAIIHAGQPNAFVKFEQTLSNVTVGQLPAIKTPSSSETTFPGFLPQ